MKIRLGILLLIIGVLLVAGFGFFIVTSTLSSPTKMTLYLPKDSEKNSVDQYRGKKNKLTLVLLKDEKIFGYYGDFIKGGRLVLLNEVVKLIADGQQMFSRDSLIVLIKPTKEASYQITVDVSDIMTTNNIEKYSMYDPDKNEKEYLKIDE